MCHQLLCLLLSLSSCLGRRSARSIARTIGIAFAASLASDDSIAIDTLDRMRREKCQTLVALSGIGNNTTLHIVISSCQDSAIDAALS